MKLEGKVLTNTSVGELKKLTGGAMGNLERALRRENGHDQT